MLNSALFHGAGAACQSSSVILCKSHQRWLTHSTGLMWTAVDIFWSNTLCCTHFELFAMTQGQFSDAFYGHYV